jgi:AraC family transcriptional regulator
MVNRETSGVTGSYDGSVIGDRFQLARAPTLLTRTASVAPIGFTRLKSERVGHLRAKDVPYEAAYSFHVALQPASVNLWVDGKHVLATNARPGGTFLFDLASNPVSELDSSFDILRFYISRASLDELSFDPWCPPFRGFQAQFGHPRPSHARLGLSHRWSS